MATATRCRGIWKRAVRRRRSFSRSLGVSRRTPTPRATAVPRRILAHPPAYAPGMAGPFSPWVERWKAMGSPWAASTARSATSARSRSRGSSRVTSPSGPGCAACPRAGPGFRASPPTRSSSAGTRRCGARSTPSRLRSGWASRRMRTYATARAAAGGRARRDPRPAGVACAGCWSKPQSRPSDSRKLRPQRYAFGRTDRPTVPPWSMRAAMMCLTAPPTGPLPISRSCSISSA